MTRTTRPLTLDDFAASLRLGREAFGDLPPGTPAPTPATYDPTGRHPWGTFEGDTLVARMVGLEFGSWFGGVQVPTTGVAGVTVAAEHRGRGLLDAAFPALLAEGRERGEVVSTLYPTAPGIYRRFGYEVVGSLDSAEVPTAALAALRPVEGLELRRATVADAAAVRAVYDRWAAAQHGPLTRRGPAYPTGDEDLVGGPTGVTLAVDRAGSVVGYVSWHRGRGYDENAVLEVDDLLATDPQAYAALWRFLGGFRAVAPALRIRTSGLDAARLALPAGGWRPVGSRPYMLRVSDVAAAFSAVPRWGAPDGLEIPFAVEGDALDVTDGRYVLAVDGGRVACARTPAVASLPTYTRRGLALAWTGAQTSANLRMAGLLAGPTRYDAHLDTLLAGPPVHIRDYF